MTSSPKRPELDNRKAEGAGHGATSIRRDGQKGVLCLYGHARLMTSSPKRPELDNRKAEAVGLTRQAKGEEPGKAFYAFWGSFTIPHFKV